MILNKKNGKVFFSYFIMVFLKNDVFFISTGYSTGTPVHSVTTVVLEKLHRKSQSLGVQIGISGIMYNIPV